MVQIEDIHTHIHACMHACTGLDWTGLDWGLRKSIKPLNNKKSNKKEKKKGCLFFCFCVVFFVVGIRTVGQARTSGLGGILGSVGGGVGAGQGSEAKRGEGEKK